MEKARIHNDILTICAICAKALNEVEGPELKHNTHLG